MTAPLPAELTRFTDGREDAERMLRVLAAAECLTDPLAGDLLHRVFGEGTDPEHFLKALHLCDFVVERNSEWHLAPRVRDALVERLAVDEDLSNRAHGHLFELAEPGGNVVDVPEELPRYLRAPVGRAYHATFLAPDEVRRYTAVANQPLTGQQWLAGRLAAEQVRLGVISPNAIEVIFLQGMILYREGRRGDAISMLRTVAARPDSRYEVAVASHLVGRADSKRKQDRRNGEVLLRKSLRIGRALKDRLHVAQVLHSLGKVIGRDSRRRGDGEEMLRGSLAIGRALDDRRHIAQVLHTLGQLIGREANREVEAEEMLRESLELEDALENQFGTAQVLHTLGQLIGRDPERQSEAARILSESLEIGRQLGNRKHQAQVLYSLSQLAGTPPEEAEELLRQSIEHNRQLGDDDGEEIGRKALRRLGHDP